MKKLKLILGLMLFMSIAAVAQISVNLNLGKPPVWAPAEKVETQYYYLPDIDTYYDVPSSRFIYNKNGSWVRSAVLPAQYKNYNLKGGNVVFLTDYRGRSPYAFHKNHKMKYAKKMKYNNGNDDNNRDNHEGEHDNRKVKSIIIKGNDNGNDKSRGNDNGRNNGKKNK